MHTPGPPPTHLRLLDPAGRPDQKTRYVPAMPVDWLVPDPDNERGVQAAGDTPDLDTLVASIRENGILEPIRAFRLTDSRYMITSGHRRHAAALRVPLGTVPVLVVPGPSTPTARHILRLTSNLHRRDLSDLARARSYQALLSLPANITQAQLASWLGISQPEISNTLRLLQAPPEVQALVEEGHLTAGHVQALLRVKEPLLDWKGESTGTPEEAQVELARQAASTHASVRSLEETVKAHLDTARQRREHAEAEARRKQERAEEQQRQAAATPIDVRAAQERQQAEYRARREYETARKQLAEETLRDVLSFDLDEGPSLDHVRLAARLLVEKVGAYGGYGGDQKALLARIDTASCVDDLLAVMARLAARAVQLTCDARVSSANQGEWADRRWGLTRAIRDAWRQANMLSPEPPAR